MKWKISIAILFLSAGLCLQMVAQDTVRVSLEKFIRTGMEHSGQIDYNNRNVELAENRINQAKAQRYLPRFELNTRHGVIPGVKSNRNDLDKNEYYLDPDLENDWENWGLYTKAEISAVQPVFAWGALKHAVSAAESAANAAARQFEASKSGLEMRLFELYESYLLTLELKRLLEEGRETIRKVDRQIEEKRKEGDADLDESDVYKFKVFQSEFQGRAAEVEENLNYVQRVWDYVLQADGNTVYIPEDSFLDPVGDEIQPVDYYRSHAMQSRPEIQGIEAGIEAARHGMEATRAQGLPTLFIGLSGSYAITPNRPRQSNPFIINNTNYAFAAVGVGIRQNLDFFSVKTKVERSRIQYKRAQDLKSAAVDGMVLEINQKYKDASLSKNKIKYTEEALVTTKEWLRQEQLDYDFGLGDTKDLLDAMKKELELRVQLKQQVFEYNKNMAELFNVAGISLNNLKTK